MRNEENIQSIILDLIGENNKKFVLFSLFMIVCVLSFLNMIVNYFYGGIYGGTNIYKKYDITGYSEPIQIFLIIIMFIIIIISCYYSFRAPKEGVNYYANKIIGISFIIFAIFPILSFEIIRNKEESIAIEYQKNLVEKTQSQNRKNSKSKKIYNQLDNLYNQLDILQDKSREMEIAVQIESEASENDFSSQLINSYYRMYQYYFWSFHGGYRSSDLKTDEVFYYCTYFQMTSISIIAGIFYLLNSRQNIDKGIIKQYNS